MTENGVTRYKVSISPQELEKLARWGEWARTHEVLDEYLMALKTINFRLAFEPAEWGEPKRDQIHAFGPDKGIPRCKGSMSAEIEPAM